MNKYKTSVLVVDDEPRYIRILKFILEGQGYQVHTAEDGRPAVEMAATIKPDVIILDLKMPEMDGFEACRQIRQFSQASIIMLTALAEEADKGRGLDIGADDYITKPFGKDELLARIRAVSRRRKSMRQTDRLPTTRPNPTNVTQDELKIDNEKHSALIGKQEVLLTATEFRLLSELAAFPNRELPPNYLISKVWGNEHVKNSRLLSRAIYRLRQKIEPDPRRPRFILTVPNLGYYFQTKNKKK